MPRSTVPVYLGQRNSIKKTEIPGDKLGVNTIIDILYENRLEYGLRRGFSPARESILEACSNGQQVQDVKHESCDCGSVRVRCGSNARSGDVSGMMWFRVSWKEHLSYS